MLNDIWSNIVKDILFVLEICADAIEDALDFIANNLYKLYKLINFINPFLMYYIAGKMYEQRGYFAIGGEILIPLILWLISGFIHRFANKINKGDSFPIPNKRFIKDEGDGQYSLEQNRIQEAILYLADVEEFLDKKGLLK